MAGNQGIFTLENMAFDALVKQGIFNIEAHTTINPQNVLSIIEQKIHYYLMPKFLQAVIDDNQKKVADLLDKNPELLLVKAKKGIKIQSSYTWVIFDCENENALSTAAKLKQIKMIELLLPYYDQLEQIEEGINAKREALSAWITYDIQGDKIVSPPLYTDYATSLIDALKEEPFLNKTKGKFSEKTEDALNLFFKILLPKEAIKLTDYIDPELLLLALYQTYHKQFTALQSWQQKDVFCIRMIGLAQSVLTPETAKIFCEGLFYVVEEDRKIGARAESLKLLNGESFYRPTRDSNSGHGYDYVCEPYLPRAVNCMFCDSVGWSRLLEKSMVSKNNRFLEHYAATAVPHTSINCVGSRPAA